MQKLNLNIKLARTTESTPQDYSGVLPVTYAGLFVFELLDSCSVKNLLQCMTDENTDLVTAEMILMDCDAAGDHLHQLDDYIKELKKHGIENVEYKLSEQILLDYILLNTDRHSRNMGCQKDFVAIISIFLILMII